MESGKSFTIKLLYITAIAEILSLGWKFFMPVHWVTPTILLLPPFFLGLTLVIHSYLSASFNQKFQKFLNRYLIITTLKLIGLLAIMGIYVFTYPKDAIPFVLTLFVNYLIFTIFEARSLILHSKKHD